MYGRHGRIDVDAEDVQPATLRRAREGRTYVANRNGWAIGAAVVVVLVMFGCCTTDDDPAGSSGRVAATATTAPEDRDVWVGTVASQPDNYGFAPEIGIDLRDGHIESVALAHIGEPVCGNDARVVEYAEDDVRAAAAAGEPLLRDVAQQGLTVAGTRSWFTAQLRPTTRRT
ncbi:MAG: hypothetical protein WAX14_03170 [Rhodococcus sp. (in: high G+C Gram-positive bacteria)]|uniref:hypothetical protein n=1 Tax=Rhodococcus sp. TaxID=1831 RepID=UPI003BB6BB11